MEKTHLIQMTTSDMHMFHFFTLWNKNLLSITQLSTYVLWIWTTSSLNSTRPMLMSGGDIVNIFIAQKCVDRYIHEVIAWKILMVWYVRRVQILLIHVTTADMHMFHFDFWLHKIKRTQNSLSPCAVMHFESSNVLKKCGM